jgi:hypothetical protein
MAEWTVVTAASTDTCETSRGPPRSQRQTGHEEPVWVAPLTAPATAGPCVVSGENVRFGALCTCAKSAKTASSTYGRQAATNARRHAECRITRFRNGVMA